MAGERPRRFCSRERNRRTPEGRAAARVCMRIYETWADDVREKEATNGKHGGDLHGIRMENVRLCRYRKIIKDVVVSCDPTVIQRIIRY